MYALLAAAAGLLTGPSADAGPPPSPVALAAPSSVNLVVSPQDLDAIVGRQGVASVALSEQHLSATNTGNSVSGQTVISGEVNFGPGSLQNFNGVGNFVVNTGANNNLQGAINITIVTGPGL